MDKKKVLLLVDNRISPSAQPSLSTPSVDFRGSAFKATEVDPGEEHPDVTLQDTIILTQLQKRLQKLEEKVGELAKKPSAQFLRKKKRRKAVEIRRQFQCPNSQCGRLYGSETSLKNHIKLKHPLKN